MKQHLLKVLRMFLSTIYKKLKLLIIDTKTISILNAYGLKKP